jgi:hypothetical protein
MEKYNDSPTLRNDSISDLESTTLLPNTPHTTPDSRQRQNYVYLTLFNLFIFTLSMISLICTVMTQKDISGYDAAKLMDQFGIYCELAKGVCLGWERRLMKKQHQRYKKSNIRA